MNFARLSKALAGRDLLENEPMARHTSFRIGGPARLLLRVHAAQEVREALEAARACGVPVLLMGNGSNLLAPDEGLGALVIKTCDGLGAVSVGQDGSITAGSGALLSHVAVLAQRAGLGGLEFAFGIPGSVGGAVYMNAGAYGGEMAGVVESVECLTRSGEIESLPGASLAFGYRSSVFQSGERIVLSARLRLHADDGEAVRARMEELAARRRASQPLELPSAGSAFKRPKGGYAAALIDQAGLKGLSVGGARVSEKHAGFVVNTGGATCRDVLTLLDEIRTRVLADSGIELEPEIRVLQAERPPLR